MSVLPRYRRSLRRFTLFASLSVFAVTAACSSARRGPSNAQRNATTTSAAAVHNASRQVEARLLAMSDLRAADTFFLDSLLQAPPNANAFDGVVLPSPVIARHRTRATLLVGQLQLRSRYAAVRTLLFDGDSAVAATAAFALGLARDTSALGALHAALIGASDGVALEAAWALGRIGEPARSALVSTLADPDVRRRRAPSAYAAVLLAASTLRPVPTAVILPSLSHPDAQIAFAAAYAIARPRAADGVRALLAHASHPDALVRTQVALAAAANATGDSLVAVARVALNQLVLDSDARVRVQAIRSLGTHLTAPGRSDATIRVALMSGVRDTVAMVRVTAAEALAPLTRADSSLFETAWQLDTAYMYQRALLDGGTSSPAQLRHVKEWEGAADPWRRAAALDLQRREIPVADRLTRSRAARADSSARVRIAGVELLVADGNDRNSEVRDSLRAQLTDRSPLVTTTIWNALSRSATAADARLAIARYPTSTQMERAAALRLIASAWRQDSASFDAALRSERAALSAADSTATGNTATGNAATGNAATTKGTGTWLEVVDRWHLAEPEHPQPVAVFQTTRGEIAVELLTRDAPLTVDNFVTLARAGYFDGSRFHRVIANFVAQDGDPSGTGSGGPGTTIRDELNRRRYARGAVGMALSGPDTGGSQFYFTLLPQPHLDGGYTVFGRVIRGLNVMDALMLGDEIVGIAVTP